MSSTNDRLIRVISVKMQSAPGKNERENIASGGDPLAVLAADPDCEINFAIQLAPVLAIERVNLLRQGPISKRY
jgi:hypothetical protein